MYISIYLGGGVPVGVRSGEQRVLGVLAPGAPHPHQRARGRQDGPKDSETA